MRMPTATGRLFEGASAASRSISSTDSALIWPTPASIAAANSSSRLPTPLNTIRAAGKPARSARINSPLDTMSAPAPSFASRRRIARLLLALTA
jgi:hypothetical protein